MRVWLQKQKKKEEAKAAAQAPPTPVSTTPAAPQVQPAGDSADKPVESVEEAPKAEVVRDDQTTMEASRDANERAGSAAIQPTEVGCRLLNASLYSLVRDMDTSGESLENYTQKLQHVPVMMGCSQFLSAPLLTLVRSLPHHRTAMPSAEGAMRHDTSPRARNRPRRMLRRMNRMFPLGPTVACWTTVP
jgi:hypothetical protein